MSLFDWLLVGHLVGDFLLQTDSMARLKAQSRPWMLRHIGIYMLIMTLLVGAYALRNLVSIWLVGLVLLFIAGTHLALDQRQVTLSWMRVVGISADHTWLPIVVDQVFHILVLAVAAQGLALVSG